MKKVGERNVIRREGDIVVPWRTGSCRNNRKRILRNCRKKGGKDETKIRFTRNTLVNSLPIEKFPTRVPYNLQSRYSYRFFCLVLFFYCRIGIRSFSC